MKYEVTPGKDAIIFSGESAAERDDLRQAIAYKLIEAASAELGSASAYRLVNFLFTVGPHDRIPVQADLDTVMEFAACLDQPLKAAEIPRQRDELASMASQMREAVAQSVGLVIPYSLPTDFR